MTNNIYITRLSERNKLPSITESGNVVLIPATSSLHTIPTSFHNLPTNVLVRIFQYLSSYDLQKNVMPVCSNWRYAATRPVLWKRLSICSSYIPKEYIMHRLRNFIDIEYLHLENIQSDLNAVILQACRCLKKLKHLKLKNCSKLPNKCLNYIIKTHGNLETIDVSKTSLEDDKMFSKFGQFERLRSLNLSHVPELTVKKLMEAVISCHFLEELKISNIKTPNVHLTDDDAAFIISKISDNLRSLSIDCNSLTNIFFDTLYNCSKLTRLCLYGAKNFTAEVLQDLWICLPQLKEFKLRNAHHVSSKDFEYMFSNNETAVQQLTLLDLTGCWKLNDAALEIIVSNCPKLISLTLKSCKRVKNLANICSSLKNLIYLNMAFCIELETDKDISWPLRLKEFVIHWDVNIIHTINKLIESNDEIQIYLAKSEYNKSLAKYNTKITD